MKKPNDYCLEIIFTTFYENAFINPIVDNIK